MTTTQSMSSAIKGILGEKLGMTQVFDAQNKIVPVTVISAGPCVVTQLRTIEKDGYTAVQLAYGAKLSNNTRTSRDNSYWHNFILGIKDLSHTQLLAQDAFNGRGH